MVNDEEIIHKLNVLKHDFIKCGVCKGVLHISEKKCRWCGSKKKLKASALDFFKLTLTVLSCVFFYFLGYMKFNLLIVMPVIIAYSIILSRKYKIRWLTKHVF